MLFAFKIEWRLVPSSARIMFYQLIDWYRVGWSYGRKLEHPIQLNWSVNLCGERVQHKSRCSFVESVFSLLLVDEINMLKLRTL